MSERREKIMSITTTAVQWLWHKCLSPDVNQPRKHFDSAALEELKESFRVHGFQGEISHILVRPSNHVRVTNHEFGSQTVYRIETRWRRDPEETWTVYQETTEESHVEVLLLEAARFDIIFGERRWRAAGEIGLEKVPCCVVVKTDAEVLELQLIENLQRHQLNPMEEALAYQRMLDFRGAEGEALFSLEKLAKRVGLTPRHVQNQLSLARLRDTEAEKAIVEGTLQASHGYIIARLPTKELRAEVTRKALRPEYGVSMTYKELEQMVKINYMVELRGANFPLDDVGLVPLIQDESTGEQVAGGSCRECPNNSANLAEKLGGRMHMCLNPSCFAMKQSAAYERWRVEIEAKAAPNVSVLSSQDSRQVWDFDGKHLSPNSPYIDLEECPRDFDVKPDVENSRPWKALVTPDVPKVLAQDDGGKVHELVLRQVAMESANLAGNAIFKEIPKPKRESEYHDGMARKEDGSLTSIHEAETLQKKAEREEAEAQAAREEEQRQVVLAAQLQAVLEAAADGKVPDEFWRPAFGVLVSAQCYLAGALGKSVEVEDVSKVEIPFVIQKLVGRFLTIAEALLSNEEYEKELGRWAKIWRVDIKRAKREAISKLLKEEKERTAAAASTEPLVWQGQFDEADHFEWNEQAVAVNPNIAELKFPKKAKVAQAAVEVARSAHGWHFGFTVVTKLWANQAPCTSAAVSYANRDLAFKAGLLGIELSLKENNAPAEALEFVAGVVASVHVPLIDPEKKVKKGRGK